jgi:hypothetical protein
MVERWKAQLIAILLDKWHVGKGTDAQAYVNKGARRGTDKKS